MGSSSSSIQTLVNSQDLRRTGLTNVLFGKGFVGTWILARAPVCGFLWAKPNKGRIHEAQAASHQHRVP